MRYHLLQFTIILLLPLPALQAGMTDAQALVVIDRFLNEPLSSSAKEAARQILQYAEETPNHEVAIEAKYVPWFGETSPPEESELLLAAFLAGNLKEQISKGTSRPEPYPGLLAVIDVYKKMRAHRAGYRISSVEDLITLEERGALKAYIEKK